MIHFIARFVLTNFKCYVEVEIKYYSNYNAVRLFYYLCMLQIKSLAHDDYDSTFHAVSERQNDLDVGLRSFG